MNPRLIDAVALIFAAETGDMEEVMTILSRGTVDKAILLHTAVRLERKEFVDLMLAAGVDIDEVDENDHTPCEECVLSRQADMLAWLIQRGARLHGKMLNYACGLRSEPAVFVLAQAGAPVDHDTTLCRVAGQSTRVVQALLDHDVNVKDVRTLFGGTALHMAAREQNDAELFDMLIKVVNVDPNVVNNNQETCAHIAAYYGNFEAFSALAAAGVDLNRRNRWGQTALHIAADRNHLRCVLVLLAYGADVHIKSNGGKPALHMALKRAVNSSMEASPIVHALLAAGATTDGCVDNDHSRLLTVGASWLQVKLARNLIGGIQLGGVLKRALLVCIALESAKLDALQTCAILKQVCGRAGAFVPFHHWWRIATTVKHFKE